MGTSNGKIYKPVDLADIAQCLGESSRDLGTLCRSDKVNKWSKHKPVNTEYLGVLDEEGFKNATTDGYYYGVKMSTEVDNLVGILDVDFEYDQPMSGLSFRARDFDGYDHNAVPTVTGSISARYYDTEFSLNASVGVDVFGRNTTGINIGELLRGDAPALDKLGAMYPCILIKNINSGKIWAKALRRAGNHAISTLKYGTFDTDWEEDWVCDLSDNSDFTSNDSDVMVQMSLFLANEIQVGVIVDLTEWTEIREGRLDISSFFAVPNATNVRLTLMRYVAGYTPYFLGSESIYITSDADKIRISAGVTPDGNANGYLQLTGMSRIPVAFFNGRAPIIEYSLSDFGLAWAPEAPSAKIMATLTVGENTATREYILHFV